MRGDPLQALLVLVIGSAGGGGVWGLWRMFTRDFLGPYREDQTSLREDVKELRGEVETALEVARAAREATERCEEREARLRRFLISNGLDIPPETP